MKKFIKTVFTHPERGAIYALGNCKNCHGTGRLGLNANSLKMVPCKCIKTEAELAVVRRSEN